jgi:pyruvate formate lyase activating enzyme
MIAKWWEKTEKNKVLCTLCPRYCKIGDGQAGFCYIRKNRGGVLYQDGYGTSTGFAADPIEKKPLNHFLPGTLALSFGTAGCNLGCKFCQNWDISKAKLDEVRSSKKLIPEHVVDLAVKYNCSSIAYTYNDPTIWGEWVIDIAKVAREYGIKNVMVTAGYITKEAREEIYPWIDAANIDLKAFTEVFYHKLTFSHLEDILDTIKWMYNETDVWVELTNLVIPGHNDDLDEFKEMSEWVLENCDENIPLHFTAFHPDFKMLDTPKTPLATLTRARKIALDMGMKYVYVGNVFDRNGQITYCPNCQEALIQRDWHSVKINVMKENKCSKCDTIIPGLFTKTPFVSSGMRYGIGLS